MENFTSFFANLDLQKYMDFAIEGTMSYAPKVI
jgi:hypothetical protein